MAQGKQVFDGLKLLEFGSGAAGPSATRYLVDQGATVVRIESQARPDFLRLYPPHYGEPKLDGALGFAVLNGGKLSVAINLRDPKGVDVVRKMVAWADVVTENFSPGNMAKFGLAYDDLIKIKPDLVMVSGCLQGQTGPHKDYPGFGGQGSALSGFNYWAGWPDREPVGPQGTISDSLAPRFMATAIMGGLLYRRRTGKGIYLDLSQIEACGYSLSWVILQQTANGRIPPRLGNRSEWAAPQGAFPCQGDDRWIAIAVHNDQEWQGLTQVMGNPGWTQTPDMESVLGRLRNQDELERRIGEWTITHTAEDLMKQLQDAGVPAAVVQDVEDNANDPQHKERNTWIVHEHPVIGKHVYTNLGFILPKAPRQVQAPAPLLGQHTREFLRDQIGMPEAEIDELIQAGALK